MKLPFDFKDKRKQTIVLIVLGALILFVLYRNFLLRPVISGLRQISPKVYSLNQNINMVGQWIKEQPKIEGELKELRSKISSYNSMLSAGEEISSLLEELSNIARVSNVKIIGINPSMILNPDKRVPYQEVPISIKARCGYHQLGYFISKLEGGGRLFAIKDIKITGNPENPRDHNVSLVVSTFLLPED